MNKSTKPYVLYDRLLLILSDDSMSSEWVETEIARARQKRQTKSVQALQSTLCPLRESEQKLRRRHRQGFGTGDAPFIPDFSPLKIGHDAYSRAFERFAERPTG
jgi:hypothetical protein